MVKVRRPAVAGLFYEDNSEFLRRQIEECFLHKLGPGRLPPKPQQYSKSVLGVVAPHAGYMYSGPVAAHSYLKLAESGRPKVLFIFGPNHHGRGDPIAISSMEYWLTPLGKLKVDLELGKELAERSGIASLEDFAHIYEHSIEVQLPFIQYVFGGDVSIVPVCMMLQYPRAAEVLGKAVASMIEEHELKAYIIASSDFNHYEPAEVTERKDKKALEKILALDYKGLYDVVVETPISVCGPGPIMVLLVAARELKAKNVEILKYANSGDITGDYSAVVSYASIAVKW